MLAYCAPIEEMEFLLFDVLRGEAAFAELGFESASRETVLHTLRQAAGTAERTMLPLLQSGDAEGCTFVDGGGVRAPKGFRDAYQALVKSGWVAPTLSLEQGGSELPMSVALLAGEMFGAANFPLYDYLILSQTGAELLVTHGSRALVDHWVPRMMSGEVAGSLCLTEPQCGSDLSLITCRAEPNGDGTYAIRGTKIFISGGDHDLTPDIAHLVAARLPDAPPGARGISLFLVPKLLPADGGRSPVRNRRHAARVEHKIGYAGSSTCEMVFDGAAGWLVGKPHKGLFVMFTAINPTRLQVGLQGQCTASIAYQNALRYALDRRQGRALAGAAEPSAPADPLIVHPDVRRLLLSTRTFVDGARAVIAWCGLLHDTSRRHKDGARRSEAGQMLAFMTPIVKSVFTDLGFESCNSCMQVLGGHGYIRESGMEQLVRDVRLSQIVEGSNGIQAIDLIKRKLLPDGGATYRRLAEEMRRTAGEASEQPKLATLAAELSIRVEELDMATRELIERTTRDPNEMGSAGADYQRALGLLILGWHWLKIATVSSRAAASAQAKSRFALAQIYFGRTLPAISAHLTAARSSSAALLRYPATSF